MMRVDTLYSAAFADMTGDMPQQASRKEDLRIPERRFNDFEKMLSEKF